MSKIVLRFSEQCFNPAQRFRIDAITLFAVPATGPHGFHAIGR